MPSHPATDHALTLLFSVTFFPLGIPSTTLLVCGAVDVSSFLGANLIPFVLRRCFRFPSA